MTGPLQVPVAFDELDELRRSVRRFVDKEVEPFIENWETEGHMPARALIAKLGQAGFIGVDIPEADGGQGLNFCYALVIAEELGSIRCLGTMAVLASHMHDAVPLLHACGSESARGELLEPLIRGERVATTPLIDRNAAGIAPIAIALASDGGTVAEARFSACNAIDADWLLLVGSAAYPGHAGTPTLLVAPVKALGVTVAAKPKQLGWWSANAAQVELRNLQFAPYQVNELTGGAADALDLWRCKRQTLEAARSLRWMERLIDQTADYTRQRQVFGTPLLDRQAVHFNLADLQMRVEALRALCWHTAAHIVAGRPAVRLAAAAQLTSLRLVQAVADDCMQFWGGMGFMAENPPARAWRDAMLGSFNQERALLTAISRDMGIGPA